MRSRGPHRAHGLRHGRGEGGRVSNRRRCVRRHAFDATPPGAISSRRGTLAGTPLYLAPEVLDGAAQTPRSDVYALGVLLFYALSGTFPVGEAASARSRIASAKANGRPCLEARAEVPDALRAVVDKALATDPAARFQTADAMAAALDEAGRALARGHAPQCRRTCSGCAALTVSTVSTPSRWRCGRGKAWHLATAIAGCGNAGRGRLALCVTLFRRVGTARAEAPRTSCWSPPSKHVWRCRPRPEVERAVAEAVNETLRLCGRCARPRQQGSRYMRRAPHSALHATSAREAALRDGGIRRRSPGRHRHE